MVEGGPTAEAQSILTKSNQTSGATKSHTGRLDSSTITQINSAESKITGSAQLVSGGPTAEAQQHSNEPINSDNLHDITKDEKKVTGGQRVKGGPTATAQSELGKSRL